MIPSDCRKFNSDEPDYEDQHPWWTDVWAFASRAGHPVFKNVLERCINEGKRCPKEDMLGPMFAGFLVDAMNTMYPKPSTNIIEKMSWEKIDSETGGWKIPALNMEKIHVGSWRNYSSTEDFVNKQGQAYKELGLEFSPKEKANKDFFHRLMDSVWTPSKARMPPNGSAIMVAVCNL